MRSLLYTLLTSFAMSLITDCGSIFQLTELALNPATPVRGQPLDMIVKFNNPGREVYDGEVTTSISVNYIPYPTSTEALCTNTECPIVTGFNDRSTSSVWPESVSGRVTSKIIWSDLNGDQLLCISILSNVAGVTGLRGGRKNVTEIESLRNAFRWEDVCFESERPKDLVIWHNTTLF